MKGVIRPQRGRPSKVVKSSTPTRGGRLSRQQQLGALVSTHDLSEQHDDGVKPDDVVAESDIVYHETSLLSSEYSAAVAAAAAATVAAAHHRQQHHEGDLTGAGAEDEVDDIEADADMEEDDGVASAMAQAQHVQNVDLETAARMTAANILANGGGPGGGGGNGSEQHQHQHQHQPQPGQQQMQQGLVDGLGHAHQPIAPMGGTQRQQQQQQQQQQPPTHSMDPQLVKTTEQVAAESGYNVLSVESALAKRLAREPGLRLAEQRRPEQQLNLQRRSNVEALFAHIAGELAPQQCKNCHKGHGPWTACVIVDGQMCGSCANCWFNASGARCSFHETRHLPAVHHSGLVSAPSVDPAASYGLQQPAMLPPPPTGSSQGSAAAAAAMAAAFNNFGGPMSPIVQYTVTSAMAAVRNADKKTRHLIMVEIAAKQLALHMAEYEDAVASEEAGQPPGGQQIMGGEDGGN